MFAIQPWSRAAKAPALALLVGLLAPIGAFAASPEQEYLAARDRYNEEIDKADGAKDLRETAANDLEKRLRAMIGHVVLDGFPAMGRLNAALGSDRYTFGELDGLVFYYGDADEQGEKSDDVDSVVVTTDGLLDKWLVNHPSRPGVEGDDPRPNSGAAAPRTAAAAMQSDKFYTQAVSRNGLMARYASVPVVAPPGAKFAQALLVTGDIRGPEIPSTPNRLLIALEKGGRVFLVNVKPVVDIKAASECDLLEAAYEYRAGLVETEKANVTNPRALAELDKLNKALNDKAPTSFFACFREKLVTTPEYKAVTKQAAAMIEALARN